MYGWISRICLGIFWYEPLCLFQCQNYSRVQKVKTSILGCYSILGCREGISLPPIFSKFFEKLIYSAGQK